jgi:hypothetical protein
MLLTLLACTQSNSGKGTDVVDSGGVIESRDYACGWEANDPGDLASTGNGTGDVAIDWTVTDQCGDDYHLWDGHGKYTLVMAPPFW